MTDYQKYENLWAKFRMLAENCSCILERYGSLHNCPPDERIEVIRLAKEQEFVQQEINELFAVNGGVISA